LCLREMATLEWEDLHLGKDPTVTVQARKAPSQVPQQTATTK
jgi:hypothetical protein